MSTAMYDDECQTSKKNDREYYVYRLVDPNTGHTFYVGKGKGDRVFQHVKEANRLISLVRRNGLNRLLERKFQKNTASEVWQILSYIRNQIVSSSRKINLNK